MRGYPLRGLSRLAGSRPSGRLRSYSPESGAIAAILKWPLGVLRPLGALLVVLALAGCGMPQPAFKNTDVTGTDCCRDFRLTDHKGETRTLADFRGKAVVIFFGYTQCPDVCPTTMAEMKAVLGQLGADAQRVQVLFVTLDPERDT
ncbi:MAG: SCO family protein, partial [Burkholderiales bacterium]|nr:SCO family protein [Burkholderiales bacterium]